MGPLSPTAPSDSEFFSWDSFSEPTKRLWYLPGLGYQRTCS